LARNAGVSTPSVTRFESGGNATILVVEKLKSALETAGIEIEQPGKPDKAAQALVIILDDGSRIRLRAGG